MQQKREAEAVRLAVVEMRQKMRDELDKSTDQIFDLKQGKGGVIDIEFMVQYWVLVYAHAYPELCHFSDNWRILEQVGQFGILSQADVTSLIEAYKVYRSKYHRVALQNQKPLVDQGCYQEQRAEVAAIWAKVMKGL
ncbi:MAG: hypothetical protein GXO35_04640 [Gammaproteobacteria bacterium]|nr:hypothetical protein [Gammaproteobacteria bacterium]